MHADPSNGSEVDNIFTTDHLGFPEHFWSTTRAEIATNQVTAMAPAKDIQNIPMIHPEGVSGGV